MTIVVGFHMSHYRDFKNYYLGHVSHLHKKEFPNLLSCTRFLAVMPRVIVPMCAHFTLLKANPTEIKFIDSTCIKVCHNLRIPKHKAFDVIAHRGKGTMGQFYGFKRHLISNHLGEIVAAKVTTGNVHDTRPVAELAKGLTGKLYGDKEYLSKALEADLLDDGVTLNTTVRQI